MIHVDDSWYSSLLCHQKRSAPRSSRSRDCAQTARRQPHVQSVVDEYRATERPAFVAKQIAATTSENDAAKRTLPQRETCLGAIDLGPRQQRKGGMRSLALSKALHRMTVLQEWAGVDESALCLDLIQRFIDKTPPLSTAGQRNRSNCAGNNATETVWFGGIINPPPVIGISSDPVRFLQPDGNARLPCAGWVAGCHLPAQG